MTPKNSKQWVPHILDELDSSVLRDKVIKAGMFASDSDSSQEARFARRKRAKLGGIIRLEHELTGEDNW